MLNIPVSSRCDSNITESADYSANNPVGENGAESAFCDTLEKLIGGSIEPKSKDSAKSEENSISEGNSNDISEIIQNLINPNAFISSDLMKTANSIHSDGTILSNSEEGLAEVQDDLKTISLPHPKSKLFNLNVFTLKQNNLPTLELNSKSSSFAEDDKSKLSLGNYLAGDNSESGLADSVIASEDTSISQLFSNSELVGNSDSAALSKYTTAESDSANLLQSPVNSSSNATIDLQAVLNQTNEISAVTDGEIAQALKMLRQSINDENNGTDVNIVDKINDSPKASIKITTTKSSFNNSGDLLNLTNTSTAEAMKEISEFENAFVKIYGLKSSKDTKSTQSVLNSTNSKETNQTISSKIDQGSVMESNSEDNIQLNEQNQSEEFGNESFSSNDNFQKQSDSYLKSETKLTTVSYTHKGEAVSSGGDTAQLYNYGTFKEVAYKEITSTTAQLVKNMPDNSTGIARLIVKPEQLGTVFVEINIVNQKVNLNFKADSHETVKIIENQIGQLKEKLSNSGIQTDKIEVYQKDQGDMAKDGSGSQQGGQANKEEQETRRAYLQTFSSESKTDSKQ